jgi:hypothetical protein
MKKQFLIYFLISCFLPAHAIVNPEPGENIWHLAASIGTEVDQLAINHTNCCTQTFTVLAAIVREEITIESKLDQCCFTLVSKLNSLTSTVQTDFEGTFTAIAAIQCGSSSSCTPTILTAPTIISASGNYCMSSNLTGDITIAASEVTLSLNGFALTGAITINPGVSNVTVQNGVIMPSASTTNTYAINNSGTYVLLQNLNIQGTPTATSSVGGINNTASNVVIRECFIVASAGGISGTAGGIGINNTGSNVIIKNNNIAGGNATGTANDGGDAINLNSVANVLVIQSIIARAGNGTTTGNGGAGINNVGITSQIIECTIVTTGSGQIGAANGGHGIFISSSSSTSLIRDCKIFNTGSGGNTGTGGSCIQDSGINGLIIDCQLATLASGQNGGSAIVELNALGNVISNCFIEQTGNGSTLGGNGLFVTGTSNKIEARFCNIANIGTGITNGFAVRDTTIGPASENVYFANFAYNVLGPAYVFSTGSTVDGTTGTAFGLGTDRLSNVHKP